VDFALVEVVDIDVVVVIRFVAMEIMPRKRLAQEKPEAKRKIDQDLGEGVQEKFSGAICRSVGVACAVPSLSR
jgi:hypothetical protein